jgi:hypothetical protein
MDQQVVDAITKRGNALDQLAPALVAAWGELDNVVKNKANPHFNSNYADLGALTDTVRPVFAQNGLAFIQGPGEIEGDKMTLVGVLLHKSGQSISFKMQTPIGKATAQAVGSCITYMRRYQLAAVAGIAQVDDDGNAASEQAPRKKVREQAPTNYAGEVDEILTAIAGAQSIADLDALRARIQELGDQKVADAYVARKKAIKGR